MYYRLYASKNNTIFRNLTPTAPFAEQEWSTGTNTGENTIMELMDGRGQSTLLFGFEIPQWLVTKLTANSFQCKLRLFDAGTLYEPVLPMKEVKLQKFTEDFAEGSGWSFQKGTNTPGISNWNDRLDGQPWSGVTFTDVATYHLNKDNEDLSFDVAGTIGATVSALNNKFNFALKVSTHVPDVAIAAKFIYSRHTRTVFQPFIEFVINDEIKDKLHGAVATEANKIYFINENGSDFTAAVGAKITLNDGTQTTVVATKERDGVYFVNVTPTEPALISKKEYCTVVWTIGVKEVFKQQILVKPKNQFVQEVDFKNLFFYPSTPYTHNVVRHGDVVPFEIISQIRGAGDVVQLTYEYRVVSMDGFEMVPWTPVSVYRNKMYFNVDTTYFYPELSYEVFVRNKKQDWSITSNTSHKFKLIANAQSHLRELNASPYFSRDLPFAK